MWHGLRIHEFTQHDAWNPLYSVGGCYKIKTLNRMIGAREVIGVLQLPCYYPSSKLHLPLLLRHLKQQLLPCVSYLHWSVPFDLSRSHRLCFSKPSECFYVTRYPSPLLTSSRCRSPFHQSLAVQSVRYSTAYSVSTSLNPAIHLHLPIRLILWDISMSPFRTPKIFYLACGDSTHLWLCRKLAKWSFSS